MICNIPEHNHLAKIENKKIENNIDLCLDILWYELKASLVIVKVERKP